MRRPSVVLIVASAPVLFAYGGCYDWNVREPANAPDATRPDTASPDGGEPPDATDDRDGGTIPEASPSECDLLLAAIDKSFFDARKCLLGSAVDCKTTVVDECGCPRFVARPDAAVTAKYAEAVDRFNKAGCISSNCPKPTCPTLSNCLLLDGSATAPPLCFN